MAPAAVVEVVLVLHPLDVMTEAEAQAEINRLMCSEMWRSTLTSLIHGRKSWDMEHEPFLQMWTERMLPSYVYDKLFTVTFPNSVNGKRDMKRGCSGIQVGQKPIEEWMLVCVDGA